MKSQKLKTKTNLKHTRGNLFNSASVIQKLSKWAILGAQLGYTNIYHGKCLLSPPRMFNFYDISNVLKYSIICSLVHFWLYQPYEVCSMTTL